MSDLRKPAQISRNNPAAYCLEQLCFEITRECPLHCVHCSSNGGLRSLDELSLAEKREVIRDFRRLGGTEIDFSGGEPFVLCEQLFELLQDTTGFRRVGIFTTGFLLDTNLVNRLAGHGPVELHLSCYAADPVLHDAMTNMPGSWEALNLATAMAKRAGLFTGWHFLICRPNLAELEAVVNLALGHGVDMVSILRLVNQGRAALNAKELEVSPREFSVLLRRFSTIKAKVGSRISMRAGCPVDFFFLWTPGAAPRVCKAGVDRCLVEPNGEVIPCAAFKGLPEFACGNVRDPGGLIGIWNRSNALTRFRAVREGFATSVCNCPRSSECQGRCAAQRFYSYGDLMQGPDPLCPRGVALPDALRSTAA